MTEVNTAPNEALPKKRANFEKRAFRYYVSVTIYNDSTAECSEFLSFESKTEMRAYLSEEKYRNAIIRVVRGYELSVKTKVEVSIQ